MTKSREKTREELTTITFGTFCPKVISARHPCAPNPYEIMMDKYDKEEMLSDVREAMLYQLGADVSCEELNHFFTGKGKAVLSGCAEWQQCFAVEKMLEFYYMHARDETLAKQIETMTMLASRGNEHHG